LKLYALSPLIAVLSSFAVLLYKMKRIDDGRSVKTCLSSMTTRIHVRVVPSLIIICYKYSTSSIGVKDSSL
jgi:hypothetical protein